VFEIGQFFDSLPSDALDKMPLLFACQEAWAIKLMQVPHARTWLLRLIQSILSHLEHPDLFIALFDEMVSRKHPLQALETAVALLSNSPVTVEGSIDEDYESDSFLEMYGEEGAKLVLERRLRSEFRSSNFRSIKLSPFGSAV